MNVNIMAKAVVLNANEVVRVSPIMGAALGIGESIVVVDIGVKVKISDVYDGKSFSDNPNLAEIQLAEQKKKEFMASLQSAESLADLKAAVAAADADINP